MVVTITGTNDTPDITVDAGNDQGTVTEDASTSAEGAPADQVNTLTLSGSYATDDTVTATVNNVDITYTCLLYTSPSPRDATLSRMPSSA